MKDFWWGIFLLTIGFIFGYLVNQGTNPQPSYDDMYREVRFREAKRDCERGKYRAWIEDDEGEYHCVETTTMFGKEKP